MKRFINVGLAGAVFFLVWPLQSLQAQTPPKSSKVPITYTGDTNETINRRAQWIEGAKKEGALVWWGTVTPKEGSKILAEFNKIYPFIKGTYWRGKGEEIASKLEVEYGSGHGTADITLGGEPYNYPRWRKMGMLGKYTDIIPGIKNLDKRSYSKYGDWAISGNNAITIQYNTNQLSATEAPKGWEDLLLPKWKGQFGMTTDMKVWTTLALEEGGWGIEKTENFLKKIKQQQPIWAAGHTAGHNLLIAGEFRVFAEDYWYHVMLSRQKGAPVDWIKVRPVPITGSSFTFQKNAPHPNAARLFLEWQFSPQGLVTFESILGKGAAFPGSGTRVAKALEGLPLAIRTEEGVIKAGEMDLEKKFADILGVTPSGD